MHDQEERIRSGKSLVIAGIFLAFLSIIQFDNAWVHGYFEIGGNLATWDASMVVLWPTYFLSQCFGIILVGGGILIYLVAIEASRYAIARSLGVLISGSMIIYFLLFSTAYFQPQILSMTISFFLVIATLVAHFGDSIQAWFKEL